MKIAPGKLSHNPGRRAFIRTATLAGLGLLFLTGPTSAQAEGGRQLILYFSHTGNTQKVAQEIGALTHAAMARILPVVPYPAKHQDTVRIAEQQAADKARPDFTIDPQINLADFSLIFLGFPIWAYSMPVIIYSFLERNKLAGKAIAPFTTHQGSGLADSEKKIRELCPEAEVLPGLAIRGSQAGSSAGVVKEWVINIELMQVEGDFG